MNYIENNEEETETVPTSDIQNAHDTGNSDSIADAGLSTLNGQEKGYNKKSFVHTFFDISELFVLTLFVVLFVTSIFFRHSIVDGPSMEQTLHHGDQLIISDFLYTPKAGDVVVCYSDVLEKNIVKRIIATEGQTVKISDGKIYVDSEEISEDYAYIDRNGYTYRDGEWTVSPGCIFVMGDHRNNSTDSRTIGEIDSRYVIGKVVLRIYPFAVFGKI